MKIGSTAKKGLKRNETRATFIVSDAHLKAIARAAYSEDKKKKQVLAEAINLWIDYKTKNKGKVLKMKTRRGKTDGSTSEKSINE